MPSADVVVVGAGLAGLTAGVALADAGARVEVVARGHAATHWSPGGIDCAALPGMDSVAAGVERLAAMPGHPYAILRGDVRAATLGNILATRIKARGAAGLVTDGALRDTPNFKHIELAAYIKAPNATTSFEVHHPVDINVPIGCAGVLVMPGDIMVGDGEGVVVIPSQVAEEVAHDAYEQERLEEFIQGKIARGASILGVYPPDEKTKAEYAEWRKQHG